MMADLQNPRTERRHDWPQLAVCPPPTLEELDNMAPPDDGIEYSSGELYRAIAGVRGEIASIRSSFDKVVYNDVFTEAMRTVVAREDVLRAELAAVRAESAADRAEATSEARIAREAAASAKAIAMWALGVMVAGVVGAVIVAIVAAART